MGHGWIFSTLATAVGGKSVSEILIGSKPHGLNCRPVPCIGVAGAMLASRGLCTVVRFIVWQRQLDAIVCNSDAN